MSVSPQARIGITSSSYGKGRFIVGRSNILYLALGALVVVVAVLGYQLYQDRHQPKGLNINLGPNGLSVQGK
jgi:hypothetical protein